MQPSTASYVSRAAQAGLLSSLILCSAVLGRLLSACYTALSDTSDWLLKREWHSRESGRASWPGSIVHHSIHDIPLTAATFGALSQCAGRPTLQLLFVHVRSHVLVRTTKYSSMFARQWPNNGKLWLPSSVMLSAVRILQHCQHRRCTRMPAVHQVPTFTFNLISLHAGRAAPMLHWFAQYTGARWFETSTPCYCAAGQPRSSLSLSYAG